MQQVRSADSNMSRRSFLARSGAAAAGLAFGSAANAFGEDNKLILGSGHHKYECIHDWLTPPDNILWGDTQGVATDSKGNIYISHTVHPNSQSKDAIVVFDKKGKFVKSFGARFAGGGHGLDLRREQDGKEYLYHCDTAHRLVVKTDLSGKVIWEKGVPTEAGVYPADKPNFIPTNVAFGVDDEFYITDGYGSDWIMRYKANGELINTFGGRGSEPGKVANAHGIWVDHRGSEPLVAVADRANHRIQYMTLDGKHVSFVTDGLRLPCHFHTRGDLMLCPDLQAVVTVFDKNNKVVVQLGDGAKNVDLRGHKRSEYIPGAFIHPHGAKFLNNGDILVAEWVPDGRITLLRHLKG